MISKGPFRSLPSQYEAIGNLLEVAGIGRRFAKQSGLKEDLKPGALVKLAQQIRKGLRGPLTLTRLHAFASPYRPAIVDETMRLSYGELDRRTIRLAHALSNLGVRRGDKVGLLLRNGHEFIEATSALGYLSATAVQIGYRLKPGEVAYILSHSGAKALIFHDAFEDVARSAVAQAGSLPITSCIVAGERRPDLPFYEDLCDRGPGDEPPYDKEGSGGSLMLYTSGTTGKSKGAKRDLREISFLTVVSMLSELPLYRDDRHLVACPLYHAAAPAFASFVFALGGCVVIPRHFHAEEIPALIERERITSSVMVPTMMTRLLNLPAEILDRHDLSSLRWLVSVAAPLPTDLARRVEDRLGPILYNMYGATETGLVTLCKPGEHTARPGTIGRRILGNDIRLLGEDGREVPMGEVGELFVKNGTLVPGYHNDPEATGKAVKDGYFSVGDMARRDEDGFYYLADRKTDMVISAGVNIYPQEIEQRLHDHPLVADCAVIGVPDPDWGESLVSFVELVPEDKGAPSLSNRPALQSLADELREFVGEALADYKRPRVVEFIESIPRNPTGKILKRELRLRFAERHR